MICMARWRVTWGGSRCPGRGWRSEKEEEEEEERKEGVGSEGRKEGERSPGGGVTAARFQERARGSGGEPGARPPPPASALPRAPND